MTRERSFDSDGFFAALNAARVSRGVHWKTVASEAGVSASTLTRMGQGRRPDVDSFAALASWARLDPDAFFQHPDGVKQHYPQSLPQISVLLRRDPNLSTQAAAALDELVKATYERLRDRD
jgi:transcriptional regulator with XRE-family HTH domain